MSDFECKAILEAIESFNGCEMNGFNAVDLCYYCRSLSLAKLGLEEGS